MLGEKRGPGRPRKIVVPNPAEVEEYQVQPVDDTARLVEAFKAALQATNETDEQRQKKFMSLIDEGREKPKENRVHPGISAFNLEGERDNPKPKLKAKHVTQCGFPVIQKASTPEEITLVNQLIDEVNNARANGIPLKEYMISKADGGQCRVELVAKYNASTNMVETLEINYPVRDMDMRSGLYGIETMLQEMLGIAMPNIDANAVLSRNRVLEAENAQLKLAAQ